MPNIKVYHLKKGVAEYYTSKVKGNYNLPVKIIQAKLSRNILLSSRKPREVDGCLVYSYGNLDMYVSGDWIVKIENNKGGQGRVHKNSKYKIQLDEVLGITEYYNRTSYSMRNKVSWFEKLLDKIKSFINNLLK